MTRPMAMKDLMEWGRRCPLVRAYLELWMNGDLTLETMLISLACAQADRNDRLMQNELIRMQKNPHPLIVPRPPG